MLEEHTETSEDEEDKEQQEDEERSQENGAFLCTGWCAAITNGRHGQHLCTLGLLHTLAWNVVAFTGHGCTKAVHLQRSGMVPALTAGICEHAPDVFLVALLVDATDFVQRLEEVEVNGKVGLHMAVCYFCLGMLSAAWYGCFGEVC